MLRDDPQYYGSVSRLLHWGMALLFLWQFTGMALKLVLGRVPLMAFWVGTHASVGTLLLVLLLLRAAWALVEMRHRPPYERNLLGRLALLGHVALYLLMLVVPTLALLRMIGSGRGVKLFGRQLQAPGGEKIDWMVAPAELLHSTLAWLLLALIAGHIAMVFVHRIAWGQDLLARMAGRRVTSSTA